MCLYLSFYIPAARDGHFCCFSVLSAVNGAAVKGGARVFTHRLLSLSQLLHYQVTISFPEKPPSCCADVC